jgi:glycosyltransferase involved in cell wall biosynthesis
MEERSSILHPPELNIVISFIIPAHNEEALIGWTLEAIHQSAKEIGLDYEIIVVDDASTDGTSAIALQHHARVIKVAHRQIAATRNAGARVAQGDPLIFADADTRVAVPVLQAAIRALQRGAVGGGCLVHIDRPLPPYALILERLLATLAPVIGLAGGCYIFCRREAFQRIGGFDESLFVSEEVTLAQRLRRLGRFVILRQRVSTSGRKLRQHSALGLLSVGARVLWGGRKALRRRDGLEFWYGQRQKENWSLGAAI